MKTEEQKRTEEVVVAYLTVIGDIMSVAESAQTEPLTNVPAEIQTEVRAGVAIHFATILEALRTRAEALHKRTISQPEFKV